MNDMNGNWLEFTAKDGTHVRIPQDPYVNRRAEIFVNGEVVGLTGRIQRYRDGGTTILPTSAGTITRPTPWNHRAKPTIR